MKNSTIIKYSICMGALAVLFTFIIKDKNDRNSFSAFEEFDDFCDTQLVLFPINVNEQNQIQSNKETLSVDTSFLLNNMREASHDIKDSHAYSDRRVSNNPSFNIQSSDFKFDIDYKANGDICHEATYRKTTGLYHVDKGEIIEYTLRTYESSLMIIAFDGDRHVIKEKSIAGHNSINLITDIYVVPDGVKYIAFSVANDYSTVDYACAKYTDVETKTITDDFVKKIHEVEITYDDEAFIGFPTSFISEDRIFTIYRHTIGHSTKAGEHHNLFYRSSKDGIHWSNEKELELPKSDSEGLFRDYRNAFVVNDGSILQLYLQIAVSDSEKVRLYRAMYAELEVQGETLTYTNDVMLPTWVYDTLSFDLSDLQSIEQGTKSTIIGGRPCKCNGIIYIPSYYSYDGDICSYIFKWNQTGSLNSSSFYKCNVELSGYSESSIVPTTKGFMWVLRGENGNFTPTYFTKDNFNTVTLLDNTEKLMCNIELQIINDSIVLMCGRQMNSGKCGYLGILNDNGDILCDSHYTLREMYNQDSASCSIEIDDNKIYIIYYYCNGERYGIACSIISPKDILSLINKIPKRNS